MGVIDDISARAVQAADLDLARLRALAHPVRLGMLRALAASPETCACDFTELFAVSQPTISQHLKVLREAGLVRTRRQGTQIYYSIADDALGAVAESIAGLTTPRPPGGL